MAAVDLLEFYTGIRFLLANGAKSMEKRIFGIWVRSCDFFGNDCIYATIESDVWCIDLAWIVHASYDSIGFIMQADKTHVRGCYQFCVVFICLSCESWISWVFGTKNSGDSKGLVCKWIYNVFRISSRRF